MGYENLAPLASPVAPEQPLWQLYADQFPVAQKLIYLNHAGIAPLVKPAAEAIRRLAEDACLHGSLHYSEWLACYDGLRAAAARLIGAAPEEIAIVKNTSEGIATVAMGLDWRPGDRIVVFREEFPANYLPWKHLESRGVRLEELSVCDPLDKIESACRGARLLALSFVQYLSGYRADIEAVGRICHSHGCLFLLDAIQGLGAFPVDVRRAHVDALAADGHKWLLGPEGCGILYLPRDLQNQIAAAELGWTNFANAEDFGNRDLTLRPDAARYECGTLNTAGCFGLRAAIEFLLSVGIPQIAAAVQTLGDQLAAGVAAKGYQVLGQRTPATGSGIVSFRKEGLDSRAVVSRLRAKGMVAAARLGWIRASPHFYVSPEQIDRFLFELP